MANILAVDKDFYIREMYQTLFGNLLHAVRVAESGVDALAILEKDSSISIVITGFLLSGKMDGGQLAALIKEKYPNLPMIMVTSMFITDPSIPVDIILRKPDVKLSEIVHHANVLLGE